MNNLRFFLAGILIIIGMFVIYLFFSQLDVGFSPASGTSSGYGSQKIIYNEICTDEKFPSGSTKCSETCCYKGDSCYEGKKCCPPGTVGKEFYGVYICDKNCNTKTQINCGQVCCDKKTEQCKSQANGNIGVCLPKGKVCSPGTTACTIPGKDAKDWGDVKDCCAANEGCIFTQKDINLLLFTITETVAGCSANSCNEGETLCEGRNAFKSYNLCCKKCGEHPDGEPYCASVDIVSVIDSCKATERSCEGSGLFRGYNLCCRECATHPDGKPYCVPGYEVDVSDV